MTTRGNSKAGSSPTTASWPLHSRPRAPASSSTAGGGLVVGGRGGGRGAKDNTFASGGGVPLALGGFEGALGSLFEESDVCLGAPRGGHPVPRAPGGVVLHSRATSHNRRAGYDL